jgi:hypothetical protein
VQGFSISGHRLPIISRSNLDYRLSTCVCDDHVNIKAPDIAHFIYLLYRERHSPMSRHLTLISTLSFSTATILCLLLLTINSFAVGDRSRDVNVTFPDSLLMQNGGPVINVKRPPTGVRAAVGDGKADDTQALQDVYDLLKRKYQELGPWGSANNFFVYLPNGTYRVSDTIFYRGGTIGAKSWPGPFDINHVKIVGQSRSGTIIRLTDNAQSFQDGSKTKAVLAYQHPDTVFNNVPGGNVLRNLTISTGSGNPGASALLFQSANQSDIRNVTLRSEDSKGVYGLWFKIGSIQGFFTDITIEGFNIGIFAPVNPEGDPALEYITLKSQRDAAIVNSGGGLSLRGVLSDQSLTGATALKVDGSGVQTVIVESLFVGGSSSRPAIEVTSNQHQSLFARDITTQGYGQAIKKAGAVAVSASFVDEYVSYPVKALFPEQPLKSLKLPIMDTPHVSWFNPATEWAIVDDYASIQAAFDSGKPVICFKRRTYQAGEIRVPASVKFVNLLGSQVNGTLVINQPSTDPVLIQDGSVSVRVDANRNIIERAVAHSLSNPKGLPVTFFLENVNDVASGDNFCRPGQRVYARQIDIEYERGEQIVNNGGLMWVFGFKTENRPAAPFVVKNGGFTEILGGYINHTGIQACENQVPILRNDNSNVSAVFFTNLGGAAFCKTIQETRLGRTLIAKPGDFPRRSGGNDIVVPLYVGYTKTFPAEKAELNLQQGWNLISLPLEPANSSIEQVLSTISGKYLAVYEYDSSLGNYLVYATGFESSLKSLRSGKGYWIYMEEASKLSITGSEGPRTLSLKTGWNLIGIRGTRSVQIKDAIRGIEDRLNVIYQYGSGKYSGYDPAGQMEFQTLDPGKGYWVYVERDAIMTIP